MATVIAHPNVALVKYWGKRPGADNIPATPSVSITLGGMSTHTHVAAAAADALHIDGKRVDDAKVWKLVARMRKQWRLPALAIRTRNDFPTGAGLASSASGFAALATAIDAAFGLGLSAAQRSRWARQGSVSAARSIFGGFVALDATDGWAAKPLMDNSAWPLEVVVAITSESPKATPSTVGMELTRKTSPFFAAWVRSGIGDYESARQAIGSRDFATLADIAEHSCLKMHGLMLSTQPATRLAAAPASRPGLIYWNAATLACIHTVRRLREAGTSTFFTVDAGPQVKAVCAPGEGEAVADALAQTPGVLRVLASSLGAGARILDTSTSS